MADRILIYEMSPRDGLQNEKRLISTADKIRLIDLLTDTGFSKIEVTSFVSPKWVPQMADAAAVLGGIVRKPGVTYAALTPNMMGYQGARAAQANEVAVFASASEGFSQRNINCSIAESYARFQPVIDAAKADRIPVRGYVSCVIACPYDGAIAPAEAAEVASHLIGMGCYEVSLGDTIGAGTPETVTAMLEAVLAKVPAAQLAGHYHDTGNRAVENVEASIALGLRTFDASAGGLGGCPYAPGAKGNVDTFAVAARARSLGFETGLDFDRLAEAGAFARKLRA